MTQLKEAQHQMINEYVELLPTIKEGFDYVQANINQADSTLAMQVLKDILQAFEQVHKVHQQMEQIFVEQPQIQDSINTFNELIQQLSRFFEIDNDEMKEQLLSQEVVPEFSDWKAGMERLLQPYLAH